MLVKRDFDLSLKTGTKHSNMDVLKKIRSEMCVVRVLNKKKHLRINDRVVFSVFRNPKYPQINK